MVSARAMVNCGGLLCRPLGTPFGRTTALPDCPFRGEYYQVRPERRYLVNNLIYPVPNPRLPFLGVHFTRMIDGNLEAGPNAVLAWAREGYRKNDFCRKEFLEILRFRGFRRLARRYWRSGLQEMVRSYSKDRFALACRNCCRKLKLGICNLAGRVFAPRHWVLMVPCWMILSWCENENMLHVLNAPSPAATSALAIADHLLHAAAPILEK